MFEGNFSMTCQQQPASSTEIRQLVNNVQTIGGQRVDGSFSVGTKSSGSRKEAITQRTSSSATRNRPVRELDFEELKVHTVEGSNSLVDISTTPCKHSEKNQGTECSPDQPVRDVFSKAFQSGPCNPKRHWFTR
jgi:hypothetical protein